MCEAVAVPYVKGVPNAFASRFFAGPKSGIDYVMVARCLRLSPSPTKLMPRRERYGDREIVELSVILHKGGAEPRWSDGKIPCGGAEPQGCIDFDITAAWALKLTVEMDAKGWSDAHANVRGWPMTGSEQMKKAIGLAKRSRLIVNTTQYQRLLSYCSREYLKTILPHMLEYRPSSQTVGKLIEEHDA